MGIFINHRGDLHDFWVGFIIIAVIVAFFASIAAVLNMVLYEGVETTVSGTVQLHILKYDKLYDLEYTVMEMLTYSGDTHHVELMDHHNEFEVGQSYTIRYRAVNYWCHLKLANEVIEVRTGEF